MHAENLARTLSGWHFGTSEGSVFSAYVNYLWFPGGKIATMTPVSGDIHSEANGAHCGTTSKTGDNDKWLKANVAGGLLQQ